MIDTRLLLSDKLQEFFNIIGKEKSVLIEGLWDCPKAALISLLVKKGKKNILIISSESSEERIAENLNYFGVNLFYEFPSWDTLPGEELSPSPDLMGRRFEMLYQFLERKEPKVVITSLHALLQKVIPPERLRPVCNFWKVKEEVPFDVLESFLSALGYKKEAIVTDKGQFALRRGILDIFPLSALEPCRLEFFGDQIESIRTFDAASQKSLQKIEEVFLCPGSEDKILQEEKNLSSLLDYLGKDTVVVFDHLLELEDRLVALMSLHGAKSRFFASMEELITQTETLDRFFFSKERVEDLSLVEESPRVGRDFYSGKQPLQPLTFEIFNKKFSAKRWNHPFFTVSDFFAPVEGMPAKESDEILEGIHRYSKSALELHFLSAVQSEEAFFRKKIEERGLSLPFNTTFEIGYLTSGFVIADQQIAVLPMTELTGRLRVRRQQWRAAHHTPAAEFHELKSGDLVVHFHSGIGKYLGVEKQKNHLGNESEFLVIEYSGASKLFVPIASSYLVSRYIGTKEEVPTLSQLGTQKWQKMRMAAQSTIVGYAEELLRLKAEREVHGGFAFNEDGEDLISFESDFPFVETEDQLSAISAIKQDMVSKKAMDRLICGDVGYGKTEVAMRAAFKAVADGKKQVAVLVPTTVLAMQHYETFCARMNNYPIRIGVISRFLPPKVVKETLAAAEKGTLDILIGTHRIISSDVRFKDLGLMIIDEEQRFGVRAKEHLKKMKIGVDALTLSATPIPRTLYLSLVGARDVSVINTPPQDRLPIKSYIIEKEGKVIQNALIRELSRDGQAYFIHNRVETIDKVKEELEQLVPEARILIGHGQMSADELDRVYHLFKQGKADILVATTIIENGVDIPNANTILIDRADKFGLADLYQLRGRVGRWNRPAFCYFLVPARRELSEIATKRLGVLIEASGYGGGMKIAMRDLEIRGAGDILSVKQSGQISSIGFHLYCKLLKKTIDALQKKSAVSFIETKMEFSFDARLPEDYIAESALRMELYHRLGEAIEEKEAELVFKEMQDRFGPPPSPAIWLYYLTLLRIQAMQKGYTLLKCERFTFTLEKQKGKEVVKKIHPLPKAQDPKEFVEAVALLL